MTEHRRQCDEKVELQPLINLTRGLPEKDLRALTEDALLKYRQLLSHAESLYEDLPKEVQAGRVVGGPAHLGYVKAMIGLHAHMSALSSLLTLLGYTPEVPANET